MKSVFYSFMLILFLCVDAVYAQSDIFAIARTGTVADIQKLAKEDAEILKAKNDQGFTPLILACYLGNNEVAKWLINNGVDINTNSSMGTALMATAVKGNVELLSFLIANGANVNLLDEKGASALILAVRFKQKSCMELLIKNNADKNIIDNSGKTAFEYAVETQDRDLIQLLID